MASVTRFIGGHFPLYNEADQFWSHCITLTSGIFLFTTKAESFEACRISKMRHDTSEIRISDKKIGMIDQS